MLSIAALLACGESNVTFPTTGDDEDVLPAEAPSLSDATLEVVSGDAQEGTAGSYLTESLVVRVLDGAGQPVANAPVQWEFTKGRGRPAYESPLTAMEPRGIGKPSQTLLVLTGDDGIASVQWQLSPRAGAHSATAVISAPSPTVASLDGPAAAPGGKGGGFNANGKPGHLKSIYVSPGQATVSVSGTIQLDATGVDGFGNEVDGVSFQWRSSDESVATVSADGLTQVIGAGSAVIRAKYKKTEGSATITASSTSANLPPTVVIDRPSADVTILMGEEMFFEGSASDADGAVVSHRWAFGDGAGSSVEDPGAHMYASEGVYAVTYEVTDDQGTTFSATRTVTVGSVVNAPPSASIVLPSEDMSTTLGEAVQFAGNAIDDDGTVVEHNWSFGDGRGSSQEDPGAHTYDAAGTYNVTYQATDDSGAKSSMQSVTVTVSSTANQPPTASIDSPASDLVITLGQNVNFRGSARDADGSVTSHAWTFGDGGFASAEDPGTYTYGSSGTFTVTYEVTDDDGASSSETRTVRVEEEGGELTVLFQCDWPNVGNDAADCGTFRNFSEERESRDAGAVVVDATDYGLSANWPNDRAFMVRCQDRAGGCARQVVRNLGQWPMPKAGDVLAFRVSRTTASEVLGSNSGNWNDHGFKTSPAGGSSATTYMLATQATTEGRWYPVTRPIEGAGFPEYRWCIMEVGGTGGCNNDADQVELDGYAEYEFHFKHTFVSDTSYILDAKIYDIVGDSLMNWTWQNQNGTDTLPSPEIKVDVSGGADWNWDKITIGHSATAEPNWGDLAGAPMMFYGGYAVCGGDWCPRYGGLPGER